MKRKGSLLAIILLSMALLTACGGDDDRSYDYESTSINSNYDGAIASTFGKADIKLTPKLVKLEIFSIVTSKQKSS